MALADGLATLVVNPVLHTSSATAHGCVGSSAAGRCCAWLPLHACCSDRAASAVQQQRSGAKQSRQQESGLFCARQPFVRTVQPAPRSSSAPVPNSASSVASGAAPGGAASAIDQKHGHASSQVPVISHRSAVAVSVASRTLYRSQCNKQWHSHGSLWQRSVQGYCLQYALPCMEEPLLAGFLRLLGHLWACQAA